MERLCMRPGCDRTAVARLSYDPIALQVWLDPVPEWPGPAQEICELHSSRLTVPRGWMLCDRRDDEPSLFVPEASTTDAAPPAGSTGGPAEQGRPSGDANGSGGPTNGSSRPLPPRTTAPHPAERRRATGPRTAAARTAEARAAVVRRAVRPPTGRRNRPAAPPPSELFDAVVEPDDGGAQPPTSLEREDVPRRAERRVAQTAPIPAVTATREAPAPQAGAPSVPEVADAAPAGHAARSDEGDVEAVSAVQVDIEVEVETVVEAQPADEVEAVDPPAADDDPDALPESLQATSPLLSRAFRATGPQRSVLSQTLLNDAD